MTEIVVPEIYTVNFALSRLTGEFLGKALMAREIAPYVEHHWPNQRVKGTSTVLAESHGRMGAYNDNFNSAGDRVSRDCGPFQDNIVARFIDTLTEWSLRTVSTDLVEIDRVMKSNALWAYQLWSTLSDFRDGHRDYRRWRPWVAVTSGWAWHPRCYVWHHEIVDKVRVPKGPWVLAGQYLHKAIRGVANHEIVNKGMAPKNALEWAKLQSQLWKIPEEWCAWDYDSRRLVYYIHEKLPTEAPDADTNYGYPVPNDGR